MRCCLGCWPWGYRNICEESWGRRFRIGVGSLRGLREIPRTRERRRAGSPPPGERCSGSTNWARTGNAWSVAGDVDGPPGPGGPGASAPGASGTSSSAGCRCGATRGCARCGRWRWPTSSGGCLPERDERRRSAGLSGPWRGAMAAILARDSARAESFSGAVWPLRRPRRFTGGRNRSRGRRRCQAGNRVVPGDFRVGTQITMPRAASHGRGSILRVPFCHTSKCRCGPVLWPRLPISAICWPHLTFWPSLTEKLFMWP